MPRTPPCSRSRRRWRWLRWPGSSASPPSSSARAAGPKVGGVLNATFGNAAELIITIFAIRAGQLEVATASITGSILGNTLLVLGASFLIGGLRHGTQTFDRRVAGMNASMLALAVIGLGLPTAFAAARGTGADVQTISDVTARHPARPLRC